MFKVHIYNSFPSTGGMQNALNVFTNRTYILDRFGGYNKEDRR